MRVRTGGRGADNLTLAALVEQGWIEVTDRRVVLTRAGKALADPIAGRLV